MSKSWTSPCSYKVSVNASGVEQMLTYLEESKKSMARNSRKTPYNQIAGWAITVFLAGMRHNATAMLRRRIFDIGRRVSRCHQPTEGILLNSKKPSLRFIVVVDIVVVLLMLKVVASDVYCGRRSNNLRKASVEMRLRREQQVPPLRRTRVPGRGIHLLLKLKRRTTSV